MKITMGGVIASKELESDLEDEGYMEDFNSDSDEAE
jgi:hypothetical protein